MPSSIPELRYVRGSASHGPDRGPRLHAGPMGDSEFAATDRCSWGRSSRSVRPYCMDRIASPERVSPDPRLCSGAPSPTLRVEPSSVLRERGPDGRSMPPRMSSTFRSSAFRQCSGAPQSPLPRWGNSLFGRGASRLGGGCPATPRESPSHAPHFPTAILYRPGRLEREPLVKDPSPIRDPSEWGARCMWLHATLVSRSIGPAGRGRQYWIAARPVCPGGPQEPFRWIW
jgi:hypothetical protein